MRLGVALFALAALVWAAAVQGERAPAGRTLGVSLDDQAFVDPAEAFDVNGRRIAHATGLLLLTYSIPGPLRLRPEAAVSFPRVSRSGRVYEFTIRRGFRFNTGREVTAGSFVRAIQRVRAPGLGSEGVYLVQDIETVRATARFKLEITTARPVPDLVARLAAPYFAAVPPDAPLRRSVLPSAGPYYVAQFERFRRIVLRRNPHYAGLRRRNPAAIVLRMGVPAEEQLRRVELGETDVVAVPTGEAEALARRHGVNRGRFFVRPEPFVRFLVLNEKRRLFRGNARLRRAVSFAIDRPAMVRDYGSLSGVATDQLIPSGTPGFRERDLYPLAGPNLERARALAAGHTRGGRATFYSQRPVIGETLRENLRAIGLDVTVVRERPNVCGVAVDCDYDIELTGAFVEYGDPSSVVRAALDYDGVLASSAAWRSRIRRALNVPQDRPEVISRLERDLLQDAAPIAPFMQTTSRVLVSSRVGCYVHHPLYGTDYAALCLS